MASLYGAGLLLENKSLLLSLNEKGELMRSPADMIGVLDPSLFIEIL